ncbi:MAG: sugar ABC transporter permease [Peptococcaceae bacterium]|nr:sugar ABC transporter permease [Peptococcaceae bacterium]
MIFLLFMLVFPIIYTVWLSFHRWFASSIKEPQFVGLFNYITALSDKRFLLGILRMLYYTGGSVIIETILGLIVALLLNKEFRGRGLIRTLILLPMVATPVAISLVWLMLYDPACGVFGWFLQQIGLPSIEWVNDPKFVIPSLILVDVWMWTPLIALIGLAGLSSLPKDPYESAKIDGANSWQVFWFITLPLLRPTLMVALLFRTIDALKWFDTIWVITKGGPGFSSETLNIYIYKTAFEYLNMGYSSALLVMFFSIILAISLMLTKARRKQW